MTEEIIIGKKDVVACNYWEACDYYKQLKRLKQENFALTQEGQQKSQTICELAQENKELKEVKEQLKKWNDENLKRQDDMQLWIDLAEEQRRKYRSALEDIRIYLNTLSSIDNDFPNTETYLRINDRIKEVLG